MKALTVRQPYAWAIARCLKDVENRPGVPTYRGPLMIHSGQQLAPLPGIREVEDLAGEQLVDPFGLPGAPTETAFGSVIAVAQLVDAHASDDCSGKCSPWAHDGAAHLQLARPRILRFPVPARGNTILWTPDTDLIDAVRKELA